MVPFSETVSPAYICNIFKITLIEQHIDEKYCRGLGQSENIFI